MSTATSLARRIWRDRAIRSLPVWLLIAVSLTNALAAVIVFRTARDTVPEVPTHQLILVLWLPISIYLLFGKTRARCHRLDLALPIPARKLWTSHSIAVLLAASAVLAASSGVLAVVGLVPSRLLDIPHTRVEILPVLAPIASALLLAIALVLRLQPGSWKLTGDRRYWTSQVAGQAVILVGLLLLGSQPWIATGLFLVPAALVAAHTWARIPAAFELTPEIDRVRDSAASEESRQRLAPAPVGTIAVWRILLKVLHNAPPWRQAMPLVLYSIVLAMGFFLSGVLEIWIEAEETRLMNLPLGSYMLFAGAGLLTYHLHRLDSLPVSRRNLFHLLTLPSLVIFCLGWATGRFLLVTAEPQPLVEYRIANAQQWVEVDPGFMAFSMTGEVPTLDAPWGETHEAWRRPLFRGRDAVLYSPFNTPEQSSPRFEALMISRAIERVYGQAVPYTEILDRYFEVEDDRLVGLKHDRLTLLADYPGLEAPAGGPETPLYLVMILVPWLLLMALFMRSFRATSNERHIRWVYWAGLLLLLAILIGQVVLSITGLYSPTAAHGLLATLVRRLGSQPFGGLATWAGGLATIALAYQLAQAQFLRSELPTSPIHCALVDWGRDD